MNMPSMKLWGQNDSGMSLPLILRLIVPMPITPRPSLTGLRKQWCPEIIDLIERMWAQDHQERPTMSEVVEALDELVTNR